MAITKQAQASIPKDTNFSILYSLSGGLDGVPLEDGRICHESSFAQFTPEKFLLFNKCTSSSTFKPNEILYEREYVPTFSDNLAILSQISLFSLTSNLLVSSGKSTVADDQLLRLTTTVGDFNANLQTMRYDQELNPKISKLVEAISKSKCGEPTAESIQLFSGGKD